ncbi:DUF2207 domain-containing protein [Streptobacillus moniliformis]|uniref:DUF2207 domain-containing protein n=1 Tax=Streptobacillus moniliformis TaxID=34105 RepID=UPI0007E46931|nr:DUF2207 domain-containing protein [Streptobacillus moniliformis]
MKKILFFLFISIFTFSFESISNFEMDILVNPNGVLDVTERITYITDSNRKRGIYRIIPFKYDSGSYFKFEDRIKIENFNVKYTDYNNEVGLYSKIDENVMVYRLGRKDVYLPSNKEINYEIKYKVYNSIRSKDNVNQIYFNALGNYWEMPVEKFKLNVRGIKGNIEVFTGYVGETNKDYQITELENGYEINTVRVSNTGEGLSFLLNSDSFEYSSFDLWYNRAKAYPLIIVVLLTILPIMLLNISIFKFKKRNKFNKAIMVEYLVPDISALIAKRMVRRNTYSTDFLVVLFMLMQKGIIKLREKNPEHDFDEEYVVRFGDKIKSKRKDFNDYVEKQYYVDMNVYECMQDILSKEENIFLNRTILYKNDIFKSKKTIALVEDDLKQYFDEKYYTEYEISVLKYLNIILIMSFFVIGSIVVFIGKNVFSEIQMLLVLGAMFFITFMNAITVKRYTKIYEKNYPKVKGFEKFLQKTEVEKLKHFKTEEEVITYFKQILPFAIAFGLQNQYLKMLDNVVSRLLLDIEKIRDNLYYSHIVNIMYYNRIINKSIETEINNNNSYGGNSKFSGGFSSSGSSGGGFGGGGGRSW